MTLTSEQFVVDGAGNRSAVLLDVKRYSELIEAEEELDCIRAFDAAKVSNDEIISFEDAIDEIEARVG